MLGNTYTLKLYIYLYIYIYIYIYNCTLKLYTAESAVTLQLLCSTVCTFFNATIILLHYIYASKKSVDIICYKVQKPVYVLYATTVKNLRGGRGGGEVHARKEVVFLLLNIGVVVESIDRFEQSSNYISY